MAPHLYFHMMQFRSLGWIVVWYLAYAASSATPARAADVIVFAAASMAGAMDNLIRVYSRSPATRVRASYASSSTLAKQIVNGAPADVFVSANPAWMDYVDRFGAIISSSRFDLLSNRLVLVTSSESDLIARLEPGFPFAEVLDNGFLAMGDPDHVPAGIYGKAALEALGLWSSIRRRIARAASVRAALALVERGEALAGIVYRSDSVGRKNIRVVATFPVTAHPRITYPIAKVGGGEGSDTDAFMAFLRSKQAAGVFAEFGFEVIHNPTH